MFTSADVADRIVDGKMVRLSAEDKQSIANEWNSASVPTARSIISQIIGSSDFALLKSELLKP